MVTIRLLANVADDPKGAVLIVDERRAQRLLRAGYAEPVDSQDDEKPRRVKRAVKE